MLYALAAIGGFLIGAVILFALTEGRRKQALAATRNATLAHARLEREREALLTERSQFLEARKAEVDSLRRAEREHARQKQSDEAAIATARAEVEDQRRRTLAACEREFEQLSRRRIAFEELEAAYLRASRDLANLEIMSRKHQMDRAAQDRLISEQKERVKQLGDRYLNDLQRWIGSTLSVSNYPASKERLTKVIAWCRDAGHVVTAEEETALLSALKADYETEVRRALEREEQAKIRMQIREEQARAREAEREIEAAERERALIEGALAKALAEESGKHTMQIADLQARLAAAEARGARAVAQAQLTKAGHIYVISNIGSFGERVFKIGMTRRLDPQERIWELGDASVPFPFDIHMMIACEDAPALERALHHEFHKHRLNKVNPRKEYFAVELEQVRQFIEARHGRVEFMAEPKADEYRQSQRMSDEDQEYVEKVFEEAEQQMNISGVEN